MLYKAEKRNPNGIPRDWTPSPNWESNSPIYEGNDFASRPPSPQSDGTLLWEGPWMYYRFTLIKG